MQGANEGGFYKGQSSFLRGPPEVKKVKAEKAVFFYSLRLQKISRVDRFSRCLAPAKNTATLLESLWAIRMSPNWLALVCPTALALVIVALATCWLASFKFELTYG